MQLEHRETEFSPASNTEAVDHERWGQPYWQLRDERPEYSYEEEELFLEDTPRMHRWSSESRMDAVPITLSSVGTPKFEVEATRQPDVTHSGSKSTEDGCSSLLAQQHIRGFTRTEQTSYQVGSGVVHSFSVVTVSVAQNTDPAPGAGLFYADDSFTDEFELTLLDEQATTITKRSLIRGFVGFLIAILLAGGAMLLVGAMLWATYTAAEAIVNGLCSQCDNSPHHGCLGGRRASMPELDFKNDSVTAPLLKV